MLSKYHSMINTIGSVLHCLFKKTHTETQISRSLDKGKNVTKNACHKCQQ